MINPVSFPYDHGVPIKPLFILVEMAANPQQRETAKRNLKALLDTLEEALLGEAPVGMPIWIMTYGENTNFGPNQSREYDPLQLMGLESTCPPHQSHTFEQALSQLTQYLSRKGSLNYADHPLSYPFVILLGSPAESPFTAPLLTELESNPWFSSGRHGWVLPTGRKVLTDFTRRFTGDHFGLGQHNPKILPLPEKGANIPFFAGSVLLQELKQWALSGNYVNIDQLESPPSAPVVPDIPHLEMGPGIMIEPTPESYTPTTAGLIVPMEEPEGTFDGDPWGDLVHVDPVRPPQTPPFSPFHSGCMVPNAPEEPPVPVEPTYPEDIQGYMTFDPDCPDDFR